MAWREAPACKKKFDRAAQFFGAADRLFRLIVNMLSPIERGWVITFRLRSS
jgi:hypothetical protein